MIYDDDIWCGDIDDDIIMMMFDADDDDDDDDVLMMMVLMIDDNDVLTFKSHKPLEWLSCKLNACY